MSAEVVDGRVQGEAGGVLQAGGNDFHFTYQFGRRNQFSPTKLKFSPTKFFLALNKNLCLL